MLIKPLLLVTLTSTSLLLSTQAYSHLLCAPNGVSMATPHSHDQQVHYVPRITTQSTTTTVSAEQHQRFLQAQRIRQQKALANQRRINQQRRAAAKKRQQQIAAQKAKRIAQQQQINAATTVYINVEQTTHSGCHQNQYTHVHCVAN